jgi:hypothetical protein
MGRPTIIGRCIYCGTTDPPLRREHVVPFGLLADMVLHEASCERCAKITGRFEGYCLGKYLGPARAASNFRSRKKKRKPPVVEVTFEDGNKKQVPVMPDGFPAVIWMPVFPYAGALIGKPQQSDNTLYVVSMWHCISVDAAKAYRKKTGVTEIDFGFVDNLQFARMIAKIGLCAAVAEYGADSFTSLVTDLILGKSDRVNHLIGSGTDEKSMRHQALHAISVRVNEESGMIIALVRLFAHLEAPIYHVIVGLRPGGKITKLF